MDNKIQPIAYGSVAPGPDNKRNYLVMALPLEENKHKEGRIMVAPKALFGEAYLRRRESFGLSLQLEIEFGDSAVYIYKLDDRFSNNYEQALRDAIIMMQGDLVWLGN